MNAPARQATSPTSSAPATTSQSSRPAARLAAPSAWAARATEGPRPTGSPLSGDLRGLLEPRFGADFSAVRLHTDGQAGAMSGALGARAFTFGNDIYFAPGQYRPQSAPGLQLIAHELAHTIQQQPAPTVQRAANDGGGASAGGALEAEAERAAATVTRGGRAEVQGRTGGPVPQRAGFLSGLADAVSGAVGAVAGAVGDLVGTALGWIRDHANLIPGYRLLSLILRRDPLTGSAVEFSVANLLRAFLELTPVGAVLRAALDRYGIIDRVGGFIQEQLAQLAGIVGGIAGAVRNFLASLSPIDIVRPGAVWERAKRLVQEPIDRVTAFVRGLVTSIVGFVRDAILRPLAELASKTRGWPLLCAVLGRNPITGEAVARTPDALIGGFMKLIGQEEVWENIKRGNAVARAWAWFQGALAGVLAFVRELPGRFLAALRSLEITDLVAPLQAFGRIAGTFGAFVGQFLAWAGRQVLALLEIIFEVVAPAVIPYLRKAAGAFQTIIRDPIRFIGYLVQAGLLGFRQFAANFLTHLKAGLIGWLTGALGDSVYIPQALTLSEIVKFILSVLGLTWANLRGMLVRAIGETAVKALETGFQLVRTLVTEGPAAAWQQIVEQLTNLRDMVIEQVMEYVRGQIVTIAITRILASLNPVGAFVQAVLAIYNTIMFLVERLRQIGQVVASFIDAIATIASGNIQPAAARVEQTMARLVPLVISFLARLIGLGNVGQVVTRFLDRVRAPIQRGMQRAVDWVVGKAKAFLSRIAGAARGAVGRVIGWAQTRRQFRSSGGVSHSLYFTGEGRGARLTVASTPRSIEDVLNDQTLQIPNRAALRTKLNDLTRAIQGRGDNVGTPEQQTAFQQDVEKQVAAIATDLAEFLDHDTSLPVTAVTWSPSAGRAGSIRAEPLTKNPGNTRGSAATGNPSHAIGYALVSRWDAPVPHARFGGTVKVDRSRVTAAHLLHHEIHGPYTEPWNIALADQGLNNAAASSERKVVVEVGSGAKVRYVTQISYFSDAPPPADAMTRDDVDVATAQSWVDFYIAKQMSITGHAWNNNAYSRLIVSANVPGQRTPVRGQPVVPLVDQVLQALRAGASSSDQVQYQGQAYRASTYNAADTLAAAMGKRNTEVREAVRQLLADGRIYKPSLRSPFYVR